MSSEKTLNPDKMKWILVLLLSAGTRFYTCEAVAQNEKIKGVPFARYGTEKMIYDVRMGPQALLHDEVIYIVYQVDRSKNVGNPHIISYRIKRGQWSKPVQVGTVLKYDHHYAPILWLDQDRYFHILYHCHGGSGIHVVSEKRLSIRRWKESKAVAASISYPKIVPVNNERIVLYHRVFGHMGYWTYLLSNDGGYTWERPAKPPVDFDRDPQQHLDPYAGTYHSVRADTQGENLHVGFVYKDDSDRANPRYRSRLGKDKRYNLYYLRLNINTGNIYTIEGERLDSPLTRASAEQCKVLDSEYRITNMPSIAIDGEGYPSFLLPVSDSKQSDCMFYFIKRAGTGWVKYPIVRTNSIWSGCYLKRTAAGQWTVFLVVGKDDIEIPIYGGGELQEWVSNDDGRTWQMKRKLNPEPGLLYNNPTPVVTPDGKTVDKWLVFYGWEGPRGIQENILADGTQIHNRGKAFLWYDGQSR